MSKLFPNYEIDIEKGVVYSEKSKKHVGINKNVNGYSHCEIYDIYGNKYYYNHEVIISEALQLPKHLWPVDENGQRFEVDHITPVKNGGTDAASNIRLLSHKDNSNNEISKINCSNGQKERFKTENGYWLGKKRPDINKETKKIVYQYTLDGKLVGTYESATYAAEINNFSRGNICSCCNEKRKNANGYIWSYNPL